MSNLVKSDDRTRLSTSEIEPTSMSELMQLAHIVAATRMFKIQSPEDAYIRMATGKELGITSMQALRSISVMDGRPTLAADLMAALCLKHTHLCEYFRLVESTDERAVYAAKRVGQPEVQHSYTYNEAKAAGLTGKPNWSGHRKAMLRARATAGLARIVFPDLMLGMYDPDELEPVVAPVAPEPVKVLRATVERTPVPPSTPAVEVAAPPDNDTREVTLATLDDMRAAILDASTLDELTAVSLVLSARMKTKAFTLHREELRTLYAEQRAKLTCPPQSEDEGEVSE